MGGVAAGARGPGFALIQSGERFLRFAEPSRVLRADDPAEVARILAEVEAENARGRWVAGFLAYEAARAFGLATRDPEPGFPLAWFGVYEAPREFELPFAPRDVGASLDWAPALTAAEHAARVEALHERIAAGDTYQVNLTFPLRAAFVGDPFALFTRLRQAQPSGHAAYLDTGRFAVASVSPELFFDWRDRDLVTRPMKGTAPRGATLEEDELRASALRDSAKDRAENLMIVDMLRNDLGRVAEPGSVRVPEMFRVERYPTLLQMTSTVTARTDAGLAAILSASFPCASITGAPKVSTMRIIAETEQEPRGLYTGAIGYAAPGRRACFNVAIRTVVVDRERWQARYGVGSGIVADSDAGAEYAECLLKARVLSEPPFRLLETLRFTPDEGVFLLDAHLRRLLASAAHFGGRVERVRLEAALREGTSGLRGSSRVRLLVSLDGQVEVETAPLDTAHPGHPAPPLTVIVAADPVDESSPFLFHKTTRRQVYEDAMARNPGADEVILWNRREEVTEATRHNVVCDLGDGLVTPPVSSGLLAGTFRAHLIEAGEVREEVVRVCDLPRAKRLFVVNSVVGWREARLVAGTRS